MLKIIRRPFAPLQVLFCLTFIYPELSAIAQVETWSYREYSKIKWRQYDASAFTEAQNKNRPLYIFIYSDLCGWCKIFENESLETKNIRTILEQKFIPVLIDQQRQPELAEKLKATLVPASIIITHDGRKLLRFYGVISPSALTEALTNTLANWRKGEYPDEEFGDKATCCPVPAHTGERDQAPKGAKP